MSLEAFGVKNLRCLTDTGMVPIRPITVLVGKNSSGKSTFLRAFPLLRQSVRTKRNSPILWYGDEHPVDFGSLREAASAWLKEPSVTFQFRLQLPEEAHLTIGELDLDIEMTIEGGEIPHVREYAIHAAEHVVRWGFDSRGNAVTLSLNGSHIDLKGPLSLGGRAHLLPSLRSGENLSVVYSGAPETLSFNPIGYQLDVDDVLLRPLKDALKPLFDDDDGLGVFPLLLSLGARQHMSEQLMSLIRRGGFATNLHAVIDEKEVISRAVVRLSPYILQATDLVLAHFMSRVAYLAPLRVSAQRAYRVTNLAVDEVEPDGKNLAMFLRSLSAPEVESFADFTHEAMGFETQIRTTGMHAEILVRQGGSSRFTNLIDVGFGYSEVLPLAAVLWNSCIRPAIEGNEPVSLVAVEQPELHLHPAHQAKLARMFAEAVTKGRGARLLIETHSESLINGLGKLIYDGVLEADDVQIVLFDQDDETQRTTVRLAGYRDDGSLHDWPYGFLSPVAERRVPRAAAE